jgi:hypothetical protein
MLRRQSVASLGQLLSVYIPVPYRINPEIPNGCRKDRTQVPLLHHGATAESVPVAPMRSCRLSVQFDARLRKHTTTMNADRHTSASLTRPSTFLRLITGRASRGDIEAAPGRSRTLIIRTLIVTLLCGALVIGTNAALINDTAAPHGVVSLQFAGTLSDAKAILETWGAGSVATDGNSPRLMDTAHRVLWLDFPFMAAYTVLFALLCGRLAADERHRGAWRTACRSGVAAAWVAGLADLSENVAHLKLLDQLDAPAADMLVRWAWLSASVKWTLIALIASLLAAGALRMSVRWATAR